VAGWIFYDQLCKRLGFERELWIAGAMIGFIALVAWGLSHVFSGRAVYLQIGAMLGTIMAANVAHVIIPSQRKLVRAKEQGGALALAIAIAPPKPQAASAAPAFGQVQAIIAQRCVSCHADKPTQEGFAVAPKDVKLDTAERIEENRQKIYEQVVATKAMPIGN